MATISNYNLRLIAFVALFLCLAILVLIKGSEEHGVLKSFVVGPYWKKVDFLKESLPKEVEEYVRNNAKDIRIDERKITIKAADFIKVFYRESTPGPILPPSGKTVILLHGQAFTSETWQRTLPTIQTLATLGHRVIAIDLPGYGNTENVKIGNKAEFLVKFFDQVTPNSKLIIVSPSMSGSYSLELLMKRPDLFCGYVPVAPSSTDDFDVSDYRNVLTPTMVVMGEQDVTIGEKSRKMLSNIPFSSEAQIIPHARHPCYLDDPDRWHKLLHNFLHNLYCF